jgi:molybdopterin synthase sulfur carrier subunit
MLTVHVRYFASLREALGPQESVQLPEGSTVGALRAQLCALGGRHAEVLAAGRPVRAALAQSVCTDSMVLTDGVEVAFFPPVTGG